MRSSSVHYYIVNGYRPSPHPSQTSANGSRSTVSFGIRGDRTLRKMTNLYKRAGILPPQLGYSLFLSHTDYGRLLLLVHGCYDACIIVASRTQRRAYALAGAFRAVASCWLGTPPLEQSNGFLLEVARKPRPDDTVADLAALAGDPEGSQHLRLELSSGASLDHPQLHHASLLTSKFLSNLHFMDALMHLDHSRSLVWGFMVPSYYTSHYSRDRADLTRKQLERIYLENRHRYDSAFVSGFRALECILGQPHFVKREVPSLLQTLDSTYGTHFAHGKHRSWHEVFTTHRKWWSYERLIAHYLVLRNAVSAHGNPFPPHFVMEDQVMEIQYLVQSMLADLALQGISPPYAQ